MISTQNLQLPDKQKLQALCKSLSVLDAILSPEWEYRYFSYNNQWFDQEEFCEMRDGSGNHLLILFRQDGCVLNGFAIDHQQPDKQKITHGLPLIYHEFIFGEPVKTIGTTFCIWTNEENNWQIGQTDTHDDYSEEMLSLFDGNPLSYIQWATEYFEGGFLETGIPIETVTEIYSGQTLTKEMVLTIVEDMDDWEQLEADLKEIGYPFDLR